MDWLTFISTMTGALAWPVVVAVLACTYRAEIRHLASGIRKLKVGSMEAEMFEAKAREVRELAISLPPHAPQERTEPLLEGTPPSDTTSGAPDEVVGIEGELLDLVEQAKQWRTQRLAILSTWSLVEDAVRSFAERHGANPHASVVTMLLDLKRRALLSDGEYGLLRQLYELRNSAAATTISFSDEVLLNYVVAASTILRKTGISQEPGLSAKLRAVPLGLRVGE